MNEPKPTLEETIAKLRIAVALWKRNVQHAQDVLATARRYGAPTDVFEDELARARRHLAWCQMGLDNLTNQSKEE